MSNFSDPMDALRFFDERREPVRAEDRNFWLPKTLNEVNHEIPDMALPRAKRR